MRSIMMASPASTEGPSNPHSSQTAMAICRGVKGYVLVIQGSLSITHYTPSVTISFFYLYISLEETPEFTDCSPHIQQTLNILETLNKLTLSLILTPTLTYGDTYVHVC